MIERIALKSVRRVTAGQPIKGITLMNATGRFHTATLRACFTWKVPNFESLHTRDKTPKAIIARIVDKMK